MDSLNSFVARWTPEEVEYYTEESPYNYIPSRAPGFAFTSVFAFLTLVHIWLAIKGKYWVGFITTFPGGLLQVIGWAGRLWSAYAPLQEDAFLMQICTLIFGPAFFSAWCYTVLGYCITALGPSYSLLTPRWYVIIFVLADLISLVIQAIGGGSAASAAPGEDIEAPTNLMLGGIAFQLATMTIFSLLAIDFAIRFFYDRPYSFRVRRSRSTPSTGTSTAASTMENIGLQPLSSDATTRIDLEKGRRPQGLDVRKVKHLLAGLAVASLAIFVRGIYRVIELSEGWDGPIISNETYFIWMDGFQMVVTYFAFAVAHPTFLLPKRTGWRNAKPRVEA